MNSLTSFIHNCAVSHIRLPKTKVLIAKKNGKRNIVRLFFFFHAFLEFRGAHPLVFDVSTYCPLPNFLFFCGERVLYCRQTREIRLRGLPSVLYAGNCSFRFGFLLIATLFVFPFRFDVILFIYIEHPFDLPHVSLPSLQICCKLSRFPFSFRAH